jgi:hypothetical protein
MESENSEGLRGMSPTVDEVAVVVSNALAQVDVMGLAVAIGVEEAGAEDRDVAVTFEGKLDVLC